MHEQDNPARLSGVRGHESVRAYAAMNTVRALEHLAFAALSTSELADSLQVSVRARRLVQRLALEGSPATRAGTAAATTPRCTWPYWGPRCSGTPPWCRRPILARLACDTCAVAHLWMPGYNEQAVCAVHADARGGCPAVSVLRHLALEPSHAAGPVLLADRAQLRSSCFMHADAEPIFAAAVLQRGHVVAALGVTGDSAL